MNLLKTHLQNSFKIIRLADTTVYYFLLRVVQIIFFKNVNSDVGTSNFLNLVFKKIINIEIWLIKKNIHIPFGLSIFCMQKRTNYLLELIIV